MKPGGLEQDIVISIAFEPKKIIVDHDHGSPNVGLKVLDISALEHEHDRDASTGEAEEMTEEETAPNVAANEMGLTPVIQEKVVSENENIERDDLAAVNRLTKVRIDMSANVWGQREERGFAESLAEYNGEVLLMFKTKEKGEHQVGPLESCDDPPHAADDGRCGDEQD